MATQMSNFLIAVLFAGALVLGVYAFALWQERHQKSKR